MADYDVVPGTVYLIEGSHQAGQSQDIILLPSPSSDIKDPLVSGRRPDVVCNTNRCQRWSFWRKSYHLVLLVAYSSILGAVTNWEGVIYLNLVRQYQTKIDNLNIGNAVTLLLLGVGNVFLLPLSNKFGRRAIYIWTLVLVLLSQIWMALSRDIRDFQGSHVLLGIGAAPFEALVAISISDVWFVHEQGSKLGAYVFGLALGSCIGPICAGYMSVNMGWRWVYWWGAVLTSGLLIVFFFTFEESRYLRPPDEQETVGSIVDMRDLNAIKAGPDHSLVEYKIKDGVELQREISVLPKAGEVFDSDTWTVQLSLWNTYPEPWSKIINQFWRPLKVSMLPAVIWCGLNYGTCVSWLSIMSKTVAMVFAKPPYLFSNSDLGLIFIAPMIGSLVGAYFSGSLNDRFTLYLSTRNRGWREPEFRLWAFVPSAIIMPCGLMLYGVTSAHGLRWIVPVVGTGFVGFGLSVGGAVSMSYILDCYKAIDTQVITTIILIRNLVGFAITWGIQPWIDGMGQQNAFILVGVLSFVITGTALVFIVFGKALRRLTATQYASLANEASTYSS